MVKAFVLVLTLSNGNMYGAEAYTHTQRGYDACHAAMRAVMNWQSRAEVKFAECRTDNVAKGTKLAD